ncbi:MAG TPA: porin family protein [Bacteroidales bacterium]|nr:porin family protein [Bacteroidales bacterium]HPF02589.1 porin family protein [Bacteroidales bacterium]HPJ59807.1 porin family protein [Bacteroidales bacterium]HPR13035.1 porin family protein [Bacteroidales bacterium]HRW85872.1 porin family protein [Bacteroidales bacterium]
MKYSVRFFSAFLKIAAVAVILLPATRISAQKKGVKDILGPDMIIGVHFDPVISWFGSDLDSVSNDGARPGFNLGITVHRYFGSNYALSTGLNYISAGGRLVTSNETIFDITTGIDPVVAANSSVTYKIQYLSIPVGLKLQTNQIGYITYFTDLGFDPKVVVSGKADIGDLKNQKAPGEIKTFNIGYHIMAGIEYAVGGNTAAVIGLGFENNFADITTDLKESPFNQPRDKISHRIISIRLGINF